MIYTVKKIEEELDFGCEERADGVSAMAVVTLEDLDLQESRIKMEDDLLYARSIQEGDKVYLDEENKLDKALDEDWTSKCMVRTMDTAAFVDRLQAVKAGRPVEWKCPFCGGNVGLIEQKETKTLIGCDSCDMRIELENS